MESIDFKILDKNFPPSARTLNMGHDESLQLQPRQQSLKRRRQRIRSGLADLQTSGGQSVITLDTGDSSG